MQRPDPSNRRYPRLIDSDAGEILNILDELDALTSQFDHDLDELAKEAEQDFDRALEHEQQQGGHPDPDPNPEPSSPPQSPAPTTIPNLPSPGSHTSEPNDRERAHELFHVEHFTPPPPNPNPHTSEPSQPNPGSLLAHELANLATSISARADRALRTNNPDHARAALELASDLGSQVTLLCELFMANHGATTPLLGIDGIEHAHTSALAQLADHPLTPTLDWSYNLAPRATCPLPPTLLTRVLVNLYTNALDAIARQRAHDPDHPASIQLGSRVMCGGFANCMGGGNPSGGGAVSCSTWNNSSAPSPSSGPGPAAVGDSGGNPGSSCSTWNNCEFCTGACARGGRMKEIWVEDSGDGFGSRKSFGGHGLGLGVCKRIVEGWGGELVLGDSDLGGARVGIRFYQKPLVAT